MKKELKTQKFTLRKLKPIEDKENIIKNINNPNILNKLTLEYPYTEESYDFCIKMFENEQEKGSEYFVIDIDGEAAGIISLMGSAKPCDQHKYDIGYWIGEKYWGQGIVSEAVGLLTDYAFNDLGKYKLIISALEDNKQSRRVIEKNGYELEYVKLKDSYKEGEYKNVVFYSKFNPKFKNK